MKFLIDVELDGYDTEEDANDACTEDAVYEALSDYGFSVLKVKKNGEPQ
jgi:hypothetical protein